LHGLAKPLKRAITGWRRAAIGVRRGALRGVDEKSVVFQGFIIPLERFLRMPEKSDMSRSPLGAYVGEPRKLPLPHPFVARQNDEPVGLVRGSVAGNVP
jgi:hypothetical protein